MNERCLNSTWETSETPWRCPLCLLQTFLRVRANRHTRLNGTLMHAERTDCCVSLLLTQFVIQRKLEKSFFFFLLVSFVHTDATSYVFRPNPPLPPSPVAQISPFFPPHLHRPSAHTSRGAINLSTLTSWYVNSRWPLLVQVLRQICPITPPQRRSPPRLHTSW